MNQGHLKLPEIGKVYRRIKKHADKVKVTHIDLYGGMPTASYLKAENSGVPDWIRNSVQESAYPLKYFFEDWEEDGNGC